ncbi:BQ5605_C022g09497 [Microbotryum silenes-dioicae]|uniref:BQ5605_C022g09497 protein n=1 Tax=Microbotryum silenes-dioicae TaxID=796604 RepID=A0A2X0PKD2_9BASI|nr:BQ5605_C022g09497 [Microbotryum silenes-dioicae]
MTFPAPSPSLAPFRHSSSTHYGHTPPSRRALPIMSFSDQTSDISSKTDLEKTATADHYAPGLRVRHVDNVKGTDAPVQEVRSAALTAALQASGKTDFSSRATWTLLGAICANGYDGSLMGAINNMKSYQAQFNSGVVGSTTGLIFGIYTIGNMVGALFAAPIADRWGRRVGMQAGCAVIVLGTLVAVTSHKKEQFIAGRFILGFGIAIVTTSAPSYCVEIAPPAWRGRATGFFNCGWFGGSVPAAGITLGTSYMSSNWAWRIPLIGQCVPACAVILSVMFLPESPRWLIANGRDDEARAFLVKFHGNGDPNSAIVELEWAEMVEDIKVDASDKRWWDYSELFKTKAARWRVFMVLVMGVFGQFSGNGLGYFNFQIYSYVGYSSLMQFVLNLVNSITSAIGAGLGVSIADRVGRRPILIWGTLGCAFWLAMNGMATHLWALEDPNNHNLNIGRFAIASFFMFNIVISFAYTPLQALYPVECLQTNTRAKGMAAYAFTVSCIGFINTYATPIALQNISYNTIWIFVGWDCIESLIWYFVCVETQGRTLEELEEIFAAPYPVRASKAKKTVVIDSQGVAIIDDSTKV